MTLFDHTGLPLWVYIVIIAVGSILLLVTVAVGWRCWISRRKARQRHELDGLTGGPMRRVTLRRGRVVPSSQHLSLTGSKFGMRQFGVLADNESTMTGRRSPFEWWSTIMDRSQSRQDQMSQVETGSIMTRPTSRATTITGRKEPLHATPAQTPEKSKEPVTRMWELTIPSPSPSPSPLGPNKTTNFSRSFSNRGPSSPLTQRSQATLSRISERSPHHSMISAVNGPTISSQSRSSYHSAINPLDNTPLPGQMPQANPSAARESMTLAVPSPRSRPTTQWPNSSHDPPKPSLLMSTSSMQPRRHDILMNQAPSLSLPKPVALSTPPTASRLTLPDFSSPISDSFYRQPNSSRLDLSQSPWAGSSPSPSASTTHSRKSSSSIGPSGIFYETHVPPTYNVAEYWTPPVDSHDFPPSAQRNSSGSTRRSGHYRNPSTDQRRRSRPPRDEERGAVQENRIGIMTVPGKHNTKVLRKKSLRRVQVASSLAA
ncbi:hypothetical protein PV04_08165 [Phialophora macrospora]|uniref:Uncharacterized protein n=1 Tax=Phialophora macrospora TaxID=1851006 RepID=A0A0D2DV27_9EURO|nr:hypothetical protein PV04_08165 [Phialophora macrospora]